MDKIAVSLEERADQVLPPIAKRATRLGIVKAKGHYLISEDGKEYLDFASGVAVTNVGHNHPEVVEAAKKQMEEMIHGGHNVVYYPSYIELAEKLNELNGGSQMVYFSNSGAEANEGAMKLAKKVTKRPAIISFKRSFHGRTMATTSITGSSAAHRKDYEGLLPSVYFADYPYAFKNNRTEQEEVDHCLETIHELFSYQIDPENVAAMVMEPVQGEGGYLPAPVPFMKEIRRICDEHGILLIFDEIQTGFGRTGKMFAYEHYGIRPDILTLAKGIASGFPLSAIIARRDLMEQWPAGTHGGTYGGNPVACAASLSTIRILEREGIANAAEQGSYFLQELKKLAGQTGQIGEVRGLGLMIGIELTNENGNPDSQLLQYIRDKALEEGIILLGCGVNKNVLRFIAPTTVKRKEIDRVIHFLKETLLSK
ncbi:aspartate aminotransferase family protein [Alteribacillus sp. HJP-4]|uniref:aspartate aminotransferase family protein n=1 Tax=Alteribacillus sp. HJP-4 TaxID=2775394 RepID=UPI0035CCEBEF